MSVEAGGRARVHPAERLAGTIRAPGDKSVSQRLAMLSGIAVGESVIHGYLRSEDCLNTLRAMTQLGAQAEFQGDVLTVTGVGGIPVSPERALDLGNSGTGMRLLTGLLAGYPVAVDLTGDPYLQRRPMERIRRPLREMGAGIELLGEGGCPPIRLRGGGLRPVHYALPMASAQVKSCILLAALCTEGTTTVVEPSPTRDHTERLFAALGLRLRVDGLTIHFEGCGREGPRLPGRTWTVPGDFSSAAFWLVAGAVRPGDEIVLDGVGLNPRRTALLDVLRRMGAHIEMEVDGDEPGEPMGRVVVRGASLRGITIRREEIANLIDELPLVAVAGALAEGETVIRHAAELRVKESDRIASTVNNLRAFGVEVDEHDDGMTVRGPCRPRATAPLVSYGDHRIAMAVAVLGLHAEEAVTVENIACVQTSYPLFWDHLSELGGRVEVTS